MSHEIGEHDKHQGLTQAWHGLTEVLPSIDLKTCFLSLWDVTKRKLFRILSDGSKEETNVCELVCTDDEKIIVGKPVDATSYTVLKNEKFLAIVGATLEKIPGAVVASVLSCCNRARIAVALAIPDMKAQTSAALSAVTFSLQAAGRTFEFYLNFLSSHDKSAPFTVVLSTVCTVCNNTFSANLSDKAGDRLRISIPHTKNMHEALEDVPAIVEAFFFSAQKFAETMMALALIPCDETSARAFFTGFLFEKDKSQEADDASEADQAEISTRRANQIDRLVELYKTGKGNSGKDLADVFSAITDYYSHENSGGEDKGKQVASSEFGNGQTMKAAAFAILVDDKRIAKTMAKGSKLIANAGKE